MSQKIQTIHLKANYGAKSLLEAPFIKSMFLLYDGKLKGPCGFLCKVIISKGKNFNNTSAT